MWRVIFAIGIAGLGWRWLIFHDLKDLWSQFILWTLFFLLPLLLVTAALLWEHLIARYQVGRVLLAVGTLLFFAARMLSVFQAMQTGS